MNDIEHYAQQLQKNPPPPERLKLIEELDRATNATATSVEAYMNTHLAVATAVTLSLPQETRRPLSQIKKQLERSRPAIEKALKQQTWVGMLYAYQTLTDAEIQQYIDFADSPAGKKYHKVTIEAFQQAMIECGADFGQAAGKAIENMKKKSEI